MMIRMNSPGVVVGPIVPEVSVETLVVDDEVDPVELADVKLVKDVTGSVEVVETGSNVVVDRSVVVTCDVVLLRMHGPGVHWYNAGFGTPGTILVVFAH